MLWNRANDGDHRIGKQATTERFNLFLSFAYTAIHAENRFSFPFPLIFFSSFSLTVTHTHTRQHVNIIPNADQTLEITSTNQFRYLWDSLNALFYTFSFHLLCVNVFVYVLFRIFFHQRSSCFVCSFLNILNCNILLSLVSPFRSFSISFPLIWVSWIHNFFLISFLDMLKNVLLFPLNLYIRLSHHRIKSNLVCCILGHMVSIDVMWCTVV